MKKVIVISLIILLFYVIIANMVVKKAENITENYFKKYEITLEKYQK